MVARLVCLACIATQLCGCMSLQPISSVPSEMGAISPGDDVRIVTNAGRELRFKVYRATPDLVCSNQECVGASDITRLERVEFNPWGTVAILAIAAVVVVLIGVAAASVPAY